MPITDPENTRYKITYRSNGLKQHRELYARSKSAALIMFINSPCTPDNPRLMSVKKVPRVRIGF